MNQLRQQIHIGRQLTKLRRRVAEFLGEYTGHLYHNKREHQGSALWDADRPGPHWPTCDADEVRLVRQMSYAQSLVHRAIVEMKQAIRARVWEAYIVGGTLRDLMIVPELSAVSQIVPRDLDIVFLNASMAELEEYFRPFVKRRTRFGGLHLVREVAPSCEVHFDVWPLVDTWAFKALDIAPQISKFPLTPFLNVDAAAIQVVPSTNEPRRVYAQGFFEGLQGRILDINFERNPFPDVCAVRALITAAKLQFAMTKRLAEYVLDRAHRAGLEALEVAQTSHYGYVRCRGSELRDWVRQIEYGLSAGQAAVGIELPVDRRVQLKLEFPKLGSFRVIDNSGALAPASCSRD